MMFQAYMHTWNLKCTFDHLCIDADGSGLHDAGDFLGNLLQQMVHILYQMFLDVFVSWQTWFEFAPCVLAVVSSMLMLTAVLAIRVFSIIFLFYLLQVKFNVVMFFQAYKSDEVLKFEGCSSAFACMLVARWMWLDEIPGTAYACFFCFLFPSLELSWANFWLVLVILCCAWSGCSGLATGGVLRALMSCDL